MLAKPGKNEYPAFYHTYMKQLPNEDLLTLLQSQSSILTNLLEKATEYQWQTPYEPGKWNLKQLVGHLIDNEIIMHYRLVHITRGDQIPITGYDQDDYIQSSAYDTYSSQQLIAYYRNVRQTTIFTVQGIPNEHWQRVGIIDGNEISARAKAYIIAGHERHHLHVIKEKYL
ncbi:DinB family protein [Aquibacillus koreensis]|uniref:DinB family protein n=1 Tax=Aquibacillus koreensis TaxID=279446 RepID=A0A9X4AHT1_9BACI|nr:DinB family protein [Aquibacillus koreensis]MCT2535826.1 DinB family protein [Aquibacillus koreensis]MDC3420281.1 DinB family protein [Aquibacillus koreensis]